MLQRRVNRHRSIFGRQSISAREPVTARWAAAVAALILIGCGLSVAVNYIAEVIKEKEELANEAKRLSEKTRTECEGQRRELLARSRPAKTPSTVLWEGFRHNFPFHNQTVALSTRSSDGSRTLIVSEPPPHVDLADILGSIGPSVLNHDVKTFKIGHDGWVKDVVVAVSAGDDDLKPVLSALNRLLFYTSYKGYVIPLPVKPRTQKSYDLDLSVTAGELKRWLIDEREQFDPILGGPSLTIDDMLLRFTPGVYFSHRRGLVAWLIPNGVSIENCRAEARQFTLDSDLIVGAISNEDATAVFGRARLVPVEVLPPLRVETLSLLSAVQEGQQGELKQSYERKHAFAGRIDGKYDWAPILLSPELVDTEYGSLLNIADQLLKSWSNNGLTHYVDFNYQHPPVWPFDAPLPKKLNANELTYNWNTKGVGYTVGIGRYRVFSLNRTGALPVSYIPREQEGNEEDVTTNAEDTAYNYYAGLSDPNLVRVVQYAAAYQIFSAFGVTKPKGEITKTRYPDSALEFMTKDLISQLRGASQEELSGLAQQIRTMLLHGLREDLDPGPKSSTKLKATKPENQIAKLGWYLFLMEIILSGEERIKTEIRQVAEGQDPSDQTVPLRGLVMSAIAGIKHLPELYAADVAARATGWIHTPVVVVSWNEGDQWDLIGGHNLDARITRFLLRDSIGEGRPFVTHEGEVLVNSKDAGRLGEIVRTAGRNESLSPGELSSRMSAILERGEIQVPRLEEVALGTRPTPMSPPPAGSSVEFLSSEADGVGSGWHRATSDAGELAYQLTSGPEGRGIVMVDKADHGLFRIVQGEEAIAIDAFNAEDATDVIVQLLKHQPKQTGALRLELRGFKASEGSAFVRSCEIRAADEKIPSEIDALMHERGLGSGDLKDISSAKYDYSRAQLSISEGGVVDGQQIHSITVDIPELSQGGNGRAIVEIAFDEGTPKGVVRIILDRIKSAFRDIVSRMGDHFDTIRFNREMTLAIKRIARETGVDFKVLRHQFKSEKGDLYFAGIGIPEREEFSFDEQARRAG
jgi:hypothetical protein